MQVRLTLSRRELSRLIKLVFIGIEEASDAKLHRKLCRAENAAIERFEERTERVAEEIRKYRHHGLHKNSLWQLRAFRDLDDAGRERFMRHLTQECGIVEVPVRTSSRGRPAIFLMHRDFAPDLGGSEGHKDEDIL